MKRVFRLRLFVESSQKKGISFETVREGINTWAKKLDGLTEEEIAEIEDNKITLLDNEWFEEVEEV